MGPRCRRQGQILDYVNVSPRICFFIHGGAWRDPRVTHQVFKPSISRILESSSDPASSGAGLGIAAFASIDYRLSPHPDFPQDPATTPKDQLRVAIHPDHLDDVRAALVFLQREFGFGKRYVLLGHSAGGCLAYQLLATAPLSNEAPKKEDPELPAAVLGIEGIYDMTGLNARVGGDYSGFLSAAFGPPAAWDQAAPMKFPGSYRDRFSGLAALAHSPDDELVDMPETEGMAERLRGDIDERKLVVFKDLKGKHEEIIEDGSDVARVVLRILAILGDGDKV